MNPKPTPPPMNFLFSKRNSLFMNYYISSLGTKNRQTSFCVWTLTSLQYMHTLHFCQNQDNVWVSGTNIVPFSPPFSFSVSDNQWLFQTFNLKNSFTSSSHLSPTLCYVKGLFVPLFFPCSCIAPLSSLTPSLFKKLVFYFYFYFFPFCFVEDHLLHSSYPSLFSLLFFTWFWNLICALLFFFYILLIFSPITFM